MKQATPPYAELHCVSNFTFLRGASHPEELVARAAELGYSALALTDECSLAGVVRAHTAAREAGIKLIVGSEIELDDGPRLVLLAKNREGYGNLSELITRGRRRAGKGEYALARADLASGLPGCLAILIPGQVTAKGQEAEEQDQAAWVGQTFPGRACVAVELHHGPADRSHVQRLRRLARSTGLPLVAAGDVHMHRRGRRPLQDLLTAIRLGTTVQRAGYALYPNGERHLRPRARLARIYAPEWLEASVTIAERCRFDLDELRYEYPDDPVPAGERPADHLRRLTYKGMAEHWPEGAPERVAQLIEHELAIIAELRYEAYFLTVYDIVRFATSRGILCQGRGSAANSAVCYCLGITAVDPSRMEMLFERFVSKERNEPPDIDVDFEHERREEVIQYIYTRYGRERAALAATVITYRRKSAIRDAGKALGLSLEQVERLSGAIGWWDEGLAPERIREAGFDPANPVIRRLLHLAGELLGFPRHLSQHVGGFVIARGPLSRLVPIENAAMPERTVIQWDKDDLDAMGLLKVDCLGLGMLSAVHRAFDLIDGHRGRRLTLADVPAEDPNVYDMIRRADVMGVFQIESRAQMAMLPRLRPEIFYDLVIEVAIVRPGPIQGDMVHPYLRRRQGLEPVTYPSDEVRSVLERTLGVPIFQEQVIKLAMVAAGFGAGEADQLRRAIGSWRRRTKLAPLQQRFLEGMRARGYDEGFAQRVFNQIQGFGEYGFPESHAASFALLVYVSAWLKHYEPAAFTCALLNSQPMGFYAPAQLVQDVRRHGVEVRPVDVLHSDWDCTLEPGIGSVRWARRQKTQRRSAKAQRAQRCLNPKSFSASRGMGNRISCTHRRSCVGDGKDADRKDQHLNSFATCASSRLCVGPVRPLALRLGLRMVKGLTRAGSERLAQARREGAFTDTQDLARRARLSRKDLAVLAAAGALAALAGDRHRARWEVLGTETTLPLFAEGSIREPSPVLPQPTEGQDLIADYASTGLTLGRHPLALLRGRLERLGYPPARHVQALQDRTAVRYAGMVITRQRPSSAAGVTFLTLEDETGVINVIVWENVMERYRKAMLGAQLLGVIGTLQREREVLHVVARQLEDHSRLLGGLVTYSRDFC